MLHVGEEWVVEEEEDIHISFGIFRCPLFCSPKAHVERWLCFRHQLKGTNLAVENSNKLLEIDKAD